MNAVVTFVQAFGETIRIRAVSVSNPEGYAECVLQYSSFLYDYSDYFVSSVSFDKELYTYGNGFYIFAERYSLNNVYYNYFYYSLEPFFSDSVVLVEIKSGSSVLRLKECLFFDGRFVFSTSSSVFYTFDFIDFTLSYDKIGGFDSLGYSNDMLVLWTSNSSSNWTNIVYSYDSETWITCSVSIFLSTFDRIVEFNGRYYLFGGYQKSTGISNVISNVSYI